jgi:hypothetical protein
MHGFEISERDLDDFEGNLWFGGGVVRWFGRWGELEGRLKAGGS